MQLRSVSEGAISGTGTLQLPGKLLGGVLITADGTNNAVITLRTDTSSGQIVFQLTTKSPFFPTAPFSNNGSQTLYYSISGTGAAAEIFEWIE